MLNSLKNLINITDWWEKKTVSKKLSAFQLFIILGMGYIIFYFNGELESCRENDKLSKEQCDNVLNDANSRLNDIHLYYQKEIRQIYKEFETQKIEYIDKQDKRIDKLFEKTDYMYHKSKILR